MTDLKINNMNEKLNELLKWQEKIYYNKFKIIVICLLSIFTYSSMAADDFKDFNGYTSRIKPYSLQLMVQGTVKDGDGNPIPGVNIIEKGTSNGVATDFDGNFSISVSSDESVLLFSYIGFKTQNITVSGRSKIDLVMDEDVSELDQVVVVGYGSEKKINITGSVAVVDVDAMRQIPTGSVDKALQGQASGVTVINSGAPGVASKIYIRGITSFGDNTPLIMVDGVQSNLQNVNVNDIESMQVLKDAGAAAIYGVRGSNGVIVITTKKGKVGAPSVSYDTYAGYEVPPNGNVYDLANAKDYAAFVYKLNPNTSLFPGGVLPDYLYNGPNGSGIGNEGDPQVDPSNYVFDPITRNDYLIQKVNKEGTDWFHEVFRPALTQSHNLTVSGGADKSKYLMGLGYYDQMGTMIGTGLKRYSLRVNTEFAINDNIRIGENAYMFNRKNPPVVRSTQHPSPIYFVNSMPTYIPVYDIMGNYGGAWTGPIENGPKVNPVALAEENVWNDNTWNITGNVYAEADFLKHLSVRTSFGGTIDNEYHTYFSGNQYYNREQHYGSNSYQEGSSTNLSMIWTNTINYSQRFGGHQVKVLAGVESIKNKGRQVSGGSKGFAFTNQDYLVLGNGTSEITNYSGAYNNALISLFGRLDYNYKEKYLAGFTLRRDGSSKFGSENRYGTFPSISMGWRVSGESFMSNIEWLNDLKIRGSWGILGSQNNLGENNAYTLYASDYGKSYYGITGTGVSTSQGFYAVNIGNPYTSWEEDVITNIGFDASIFNNKLSISAGWYKKAINGLLFSEPLPATIGNAARPVVNIGDIQNKGVDISATYHNGISKDFNYDVGLTFTSYNNMVVDIPDPGFFDAGVSRNQEGHSVSSFYGYDVLGFFRDEDDVSSSPTQTDAAPGRFKYRDVDGDGEITPDDRTFIGDPNPDFTYGLNLGMNFRNFDFSMMFYGSQGNDLYLEKIITWNNSPQSLSNDLVLHSWTPENKDNAKAPIAENFSNFSQQPGSFFVQDGSYFKLRSLMLGYSLPPAALDQIGIISKFRVYVQGTNLFTITKYTGLDPELSGGSAANFGYDGFTNYPGNFRGYYLGLSLAF